MRKRSFLILIVVLIWKAFFIPVFAGEKEEDVMASCIGTSETGVGYVGCIAAGFTGNEIQTCLTEPSKCYGPNNEVRKFFCSVGFGGCPPPDREAELLYVMPFHSGCEAIFKTAIYWSPDCKNLRGGGHTLNAWDVADANWGYVRAFAVFNDCIYAAFNSAIYRSCNGINIGGGGQTQKLYEGSPVGAMVGFHGRLLTAFGTTIYSSADGNNPGGGPNTAVVYDGEGTPTSMTVMPHNGELVLRTIFDGNPDAYCDPTGMHPGGGGTTTHC